jgi:hypothetical protein
MNPTNLLAALVLTMSLLQASAHAQPYHDDAWQRAARARCYQSWDWWCSRHCWRNERGWLQCRPRQDDPDRDDPRWRHFRDHDDWQRYP